MSVTCFLLFWIAVSYGHCKKECVALQTTSETLTVPPNTQVNVSFTVHQLCPGTVVSLDIITVRYKKASSPQVLPLEYCQIMLTAPIAAGGLCLYNALSNQFTVSRRVEDPHKEVWIVTGVLSSLRTKASVQSVIEVYVNDSAHSVFITEDPPKETLKLRPVEIALGTLSTVLGVALIATCLVICRLLQKSRFETREITNAEPSLQGKERKDITVLAGPNRAGPTLTGIPEVTHDGHIYQEILKTNHRPEPGIMFSSAVDAYSSNPKTNGQQCRGDPDTQRKELGVSLRKLDLGTKNGEYDTVSNDPADRGQDPERLDPELKSKGVVCHENKSGEVKITSPTQDNTCCQYLTNGDCDSGGYLLPKPGTPAEKASAGYFHMAMPFP